MTPPGTPKGAYAKLRKLIGITAIATAPLGILILLSPTPTQAIWPFDSARAAEGDAPMVHDSSVRLLAAALNSDPDPTKGGFDLSVSDGSALIASSGLEGEISELRSKALPEDRPSTGSISVYTVKNGDSISGIADSFGVSVSTILWANDLTVRSTIKPGMDLVILPVSGVKHKVGKGETLSTIASKYRASSGEIATFNGLDTDATVVVGSTLVIPGGEVANSITAAKKTAATISKAPAKSSKAVVKTTPKTSAKVGADLGAPASTGTYFSNPVPGAILYQGMHGNNGVDLSAPSGTPIHAAAAGTVIISKDSGWNGGYGSYVVISHPNGVQTLYSHMSQDLVSVGQSVSKGDVIGSVGNTGEATGNHLHYEVRGAKNALASSCNVMSRCY